MNKLQRKKASQAEVDRLSKRVRRFSAEAFALVLMSFKSHDYFEYGANGHSAVLNAVRQVKQQYPSSVFITRAISKTHRVIIKL